VKVLKYPHPVLKYPCKPIQKINQGLRNIVAEMFETMYASDGVGLAANQVGLPLRLFVMNATGDKEKNEEEYVFINPIIIKKNGNATDSEGCLSFPEIHADVVRAESVVIEGIFLDGEIRQFQWKGRPARIVQHETDHLNGVGFVDRLSVTALLDVKESLEELQTVFQGDQRLGFIPTAEELAKLMKEIEQQYCE
jgi:peptide deformylase